MIARLRRARVGETLACPTYSRISLGISKGCGTFIFWNILWNIIAISCFFAVSSGYSIQYCPYLCLVGALAWVSRTRDHGHHQQVSSRRCHRPPPAGPCVVQLVRAAPGRVVGRARPWWAVVGAGGGGEAAHVCPLLYSFGRSAPTPPTVSPSRQTAVQCWNIPGI